MNGIESNEVTDSIVWNHPVEPNAKYIAQLETIECKKIQIYMKMWGYVKYIKNVKTHICKCM